MPTLREIVDFPDIKDHSNDLIDKLDFIEQIYQIDRYFFDEEEDEALVKYLEDMTLHTKIDVMYDYRRGARLEVAKFKGVPFAVLSRAGRELDDRVSYYVLDGAILKDIIIQCTKISIDATNNMDDNIEPEYWEGFPVRLGDNGMVNLDTGVIS